MVCPWNMWMGGRTLLALALGAALATGALAPPEAGSQESLKERIESQQQELDRIKREINEHRQKSKKLDREEAAVLKKLSSLEKEIELSRTFLKNLSQQEALLVERNDSLRARISGEESVLAEQKLALGKRLRQMYKRDPNYRWDVLLGSGSVQEAIQRYKFSRLIAERDATLIETVRDRKTRYEKESAELTESLADVIAVRSSREEETQKLERSKRKRQTMLGEIRNEKSKSAKAIEDLKKAQEKLKDLIGQLEQKRLEREQQGIVSAGEFAKLKGNLMRPVQGRILRGFGEIKHPKFGTVTFNNGVDIGATPGAPIRAVASGVVEFVDWIDAYGKCIILNHGGGYYTLYAHVSSTFVAHGQQVGHGDVIAEVGDTGSLDGFECHFEIRHSKQALNPMDWFSKN